MWTWERELWMDRVSKSSEGGWKGEEMDPLGCVTNELGSVVQRESHYENTSSEEGDTEADLGIRNWLFLCCVIISSEYICLM